MKDPRLNDIEKLLEIRKGSTGRLKHIKETIENEKTLYNSDKKYLEKLTSKYLIYEKILNQNIKSEKIEVESIEDKVILDQHVRDRKITNTSVKKKNNNEEPVSRFWACFFVNSLFSLWWLDKIEKIQKWVLYQFLILVLLIVIHVVLNTIFYDRPLRSDLSEILLTFFALYLVFNPVLLIIIMHRWATQYNLEKFGFKSKREWQDR